MICRGERIVRVFLKENPDTPRTFGAGCYFQCVKRHLQSKNPSWRSHFVFFSRARRKVLRVAENTAKKARFLPEFYASRRRETPRRHPSKMTRNLRVAMSQKFWSSFFKRWQGAGAEPLVPLRQIKIQKKSAPRCGAPCSFYSYSSPV